MGCESAEKSLSVPENEAGPHVVCRLEVRDPDAGDVPECRLVEVADDRKERPSDKDQPLPFELQLLGSEAPAAGQTLWPAPVQNSIAAGGVRRYALRSLSGQTFDHEKRARYHLRITCWDRANDRVARDLMVMVLDANEVPVFSQAIYTAEVTESSAVVEAAAVGEAGARTTVGHASRPLLELHATDDNLTPDNEPPRLTYAIESSANEAARAFRVDASGKLFRHEGFVFNRERQEWYNFSVTATDNGRPQLTGTARVVVHVRDVNDNAPRFVAPRSSSSEQFDLPCTQLYGDPLYTFRAEDEDIVSPVITYTLVNATSSFAAPPSDERSEPLDLRAHFRVDPTSGALSLVRQLHCLDTDQVISLTVRASDGELDATASVTIVVRRPTLPPADESGDLIAQLKHVLSKTENMNLLILLLIVGFTLIICFVLVAIIICLRRRERRFGTVRSGSEGGEEAERLAEKTARIRQRMAKNGSKAAKRAKSKEQCSASGKRSGGGGAGGKLQTNSSVLYRSPSNEPDACGGGVAVGDATQYQQRSNSHALPECSRSSRCCERESECGLSTHLVCKLDAPAPGLDTSDCLLGGAGVVPPFLAVVPQSAAASGVQYVPLAETHPHTCACGLFADDPQSHYPAPCYVSVCSSR